MQLSHRSIYSSRRSPVLARNVIATSQPLAVQAGLQMLRQGGNAVDAALAAAICLVVVEPTGNGLGSDAFCIIWDGDKLHGLNASGRSPGAWTPERFAGREKMPARGWDSVTVPGAVSAWRDLSRRFGKLPFSALFQPAVSYAEQGFHVSPVIAEVWRREANELKEYPGFAASFLPGGRAPQAGEIFRNAPLAWSLKRIAETGGECFYRGELAERIVKFAKEHGAALTIDDFATHENDWCGTISQDFQDAELNEIPPNGQGIAALMALGIVRHLGIAEFDPDSAEALHLQIEAMKLAFADVNEYVGDQQFMTRVTVEQLLDSSYLATRANLIDRRNAQNYGPGAPTDGGTVCVAAGDETGMMVSFIQSNYSGFGSGVVVPDTGISLQNRGSGFSLKKDHPNEVGPSKRPFHTIIPGFITKSSKPHAAFCLMGGPMQAQGHLQLFLRTQLWKQDPQTAADAPRWRVLDGNRVAIEPEVKETVLDILKLRNHDLEREAPDSSFGFGGAQVIQRIDGGYVAGSDPRKDGAAAGF